MPYWFRLVSVFDTVKNHSFRKDCDCSCEVISLHSIVEEYPTLVLPFVVTHTPYSEMAENTLFFCLHFSWPLLPRFKPSIPLNSADGIEATRAN